MEHVSTDAVAFHIPLSKCDCNRNNLELGQFKVKGHGANR